MAKIEWGILIVNYLFLGGLSAGIFFVSALATYLQQRDEAAYARIARYGAMMAPWPVAIGSLLLIFDLGSWYRFYKLFVHFRWQSPMSIGSWLLVFFTLVALVNFWAWLPEERRGAFIAYLKLPPHFNYDLSSWCRLLAAAGFPLSIGVAIYTGVLLGAVQSRPFWNTNLVAQLFLFSALSTGCAVLILGLAGQEKRAHELRLLYGLDICFMVLEFFIVLPYLIHGQLSVQAVQDSLKLILGGPFTILFWVFFLGLGLLTPLVIELKELVPVMVSNREFHYNRFVTAGAAVLILGGGFLLRYIFVFAGQIS